jgi:hypothetical protein
MIGKYMGHFALEGPEFLGVPATSVRGQPEATAMLSSLLGALRSLDNTSSPIGDTEKFKRWYREIVAR